MTKRIKRTFASLLVGVMLLVCSCSAVIVAQGTEAREEIGYSERLVQKMDLSAIKDLETVPEGVQVLSQSAYQIGSVQGFVKLDTLICSGVDFTGITVYLSRDVDFSGISFVPIGWKGQIGTPVNIEPFIAFNGIFDGQGHSVKNVYCSVTKSPMMYPGDTVNYGGVSFFGILKGATVKNLILDDSCTFLYFADPHDHGCAAGFAFAAFNTRFENCMNMANVSNSSRFSAGIVARAHGKIEVLNCTNSGMLRACQSVGGMIAYDMSNMTVQNCRNLGNVECYLAYGENDGGMLVGTDHSAAGMVAWVRQAGTIDGCINNGRIVGVDNVGGIAGQMGNSCGTNTKVSLLNNANYGEVRLSDAPKTKTNTGAPNIPVVAKEGLVWAENNIIGVLVDKNNIDQRGGEDPTLNGSPTPPQTSATMQTTAIPETSAPLDSTAVPSTALDDAPATDASEDLGSESTKDPLFTESTTVEAPTADRTEGCQSFAFGGIGIILLISFAAALTLKKRTVFK